MQVDSQDTVIAGRTLPEWQEFARRDDCLDLMVPSQLRSLVASILPPTTSAGDGELIATTRIAAEAKTREEDARIVDERAEAARAAGVMGGIDPIEAQILDEHLSEAADAIRSRMETDNER